MTADLDRKVDDGRRQLFVQNRGDVVKRRAVESVGAEPARSEPGRTAEHSTRRRTDRLGIGSSAFGYLLAAPGLGLGVSGPLLRMLPLDPIVLFPFRCVFSDSLGSTFFGPPLFVFWVGCTFVALYCTS